MNRDVIDKAFADMIVKKGIEDKLGIDRLYVYQLRRRVRTGGSVSMAKKVELLRKAGYNLEERIYTRKDLVSLAKFVLRTSQAAREQGPEYLVEKWKASRK